MFQIVQDLNKGDTKLIEVPVPTIKSGYVLIKTNKSLVSLGTEKMLVDFGKANLLEKARQQPEKVKMVIDKVKTDGLSPTINAVFNKLNQPLPLGYCNVGEVIEVGDNVTELNVGDRVISNGPHAEFVLVNQNLAAKVPKDVKDSDAVFTVISSIALQGIRLFKPTFGENVVVMGLGLIGLLTAKLLKANGCNVIGVDIDETKIKLAQKNGFFCINPSKQQNIESIINNLTKRIGADGVIITASSKSNQIISDSAKITRKRGRIILVGVTGLNLNRSEFYEKEIKFQVSCSYGPGRYDDLYEVHGVDYPIGFVRWTEKRNFQAILESISNKTLIVDDLITKEVDLKNYKSIYENLDSSNSVAVLINYSEKPNSSKKITNKNQSFNVSNKSCGIVGSGNFTSGIILPILKKLKYNISYISSLNGLSSTLLSNKYNIANSTSDYKEILSDQSVDLVIITTRHNSHYEIVRDSLLSDKNVFVEKPLCLNKSELDELIKLYSTKDNKVTVGFNRRFAPFSLKAKEIISNSNVPVNIVINVNAGFIEDKSWVHDMKIGGGRIIGEACHFIDLCTYFTGSLIKKVCSNSLGINPRENTDNLSILLNYKDGSNAVINYFSNGSKSYSKERIEIYSSNRILIIDNWRKMIGYGFKNFSSLKKKQDKGHYNQFEELLENQNNPKNQLIPFEEITNTTKASFAAIDSFKHNQWIEID